MGDKLNDLLDVGQTKLIGYLPIETIKKHGSSYLDVMIELEKRGIETKYFNEEKCNIRSGALFAFDRIALSKILLENKEIVLRASWPFEVDEFINYLISHIAQSETKMFFLIAKTYGK